MTMQFSSKVTIKQYWYKISDTAFNKAAHFSDNYCQCNISRGTKRVQLLIYLINKRIVVKINCVKNNSNRNFMEDVIANIDFKNIISFSFPGIFQDKINPVYKTILVFKSKMNSC